MAHHLQHTHDATLVVLAYLIALFAAYTALDMGERLRSATGRPRLLWHSASVRMSRLLFAAMRNPRPSSLSSE